MLPAEFHFLRPEWLLALSVLFVLLWLLARRKFGKSGWSAVCDVHLLPHILIGSTEQRRLWSLLLMGIAGLLGITALAGPSWERLPQPVFRDQSALVIALDMSLSMDAKDVKPSRLERAKFRIVDILKHRGEGRTALIVYAGDAFSITPLTQDTATIASQLSALRTDLMPVLGSRVDLAMEKSIQLLHQAGLTRGDVLLITDEVNYEQARQSVEKLRDKGYRLSVLGIGTPQGAPIPQGKAGFLKHENGSIVIAKLDEQSLRKLSQLGGGLYQKMRLDDSDIKALLSLLKVDPFQQILDESGYKTDLWREQGPWLLLLLLPLGAFAFRRGHFVAILFGIILLPDDSHAIDWEGLWLNSNQQADKALNAGDAKQAAKLFTDPRWKGAAQYRGGDYEAALDTLSGSEGSDDWYNKGNALARLGRYKEAMAAYDRAIGLESDHQDAQYNRKLILQLMKQQQQKDQQDGKSSSHGDQDSVQNEQQNAQPNARQKQGQQQDPDQQGQKSQQSGQQNQDQQQRDAQEQQAKAIEEDKQSGEKADELQPEERDATRDPVEERQQEAMAQSETPDQSDLATEQWLRRIPDDPGGLLRRKFYYQYKERYKSLPAQEKAW